MPRGLVYILTSRNSPFIKIGGTEQALCERMRGINGSTGYAEHGPWELSDCLEVVDWQLVERRMHRHFGDRQSIEFAGVRELFSVPPSEARQILQAVEPDLRIGHKKTELLFKDRDFQIYLFKLFEITGLFGNLDIQGAWVFSLYPSSVGGRFFTLSIGPHEVAFTPKIRKKGEQPFHMLAVDRLILDYPEVDTWIKDHGGEIATTPYASAKDRAVSIYFEAGFAEAERLFHVSGVRRSLLAYWHDWLADLRERNVRSAFARYHNYDAVQALVEYRRARQRVIQEPIRCGSFR